MNNIKPCQQCGECCKKAPCDIIPSDLPPLLKYFDMGLADFFKKYLIALMVASPKHADQVLMMVPVRVNSQGNRAEKFLADGEYLVTQGNCIFLEERNCTIHEIKPFGGKILECSKMMGGNSRQLAKKDYFEYWKNKQSLFQEIFPEYKKIFLELKKIYKRKNSLLDNFGKNEEYNKLHHKQEIILTEKLFPLFNNNSPVGGIRVLTD